MRTATAVLTLSFLCAATSVVHTATIPTSIEIRCDRDSTCQETFKGYVKKAVEDSGTHAFVEDEASSTLHIVLVIAKNTEGATIRGYAVAFVGMQSVDRKVLRLNNRYCKPDEVEAVVYREIREFVLK